MTAIQIKAEIDKLLDEIPENSLQTVLELLHKIKVEPSESALLQINIDRVINEDKELLKKLN
ncbi:MAG TPA: hypothetical protein VHB54_10320 [Mucilaginibacter sp.]|nr:hypothetical protein [Mucilaginibacter sp.]